MRFLLSILLIIGGTLFTVYYFAPEVYTCVRPIRYSIGEFDERFGLSREEFLSALKEAENVWEEAAGKELFIYDEKALFKVNLVYDERQLRTDMVEASEVVLNEKQIEYQDADRKYREKSDELNTDMGVFNSDVEEFQRRQVRYSQDVDAWNRSDRTDVNRLNALEEEEVLLRAEKNRLRAREFELREKRDEVNTVLRVRNNLAENYNIDVAIFNQRFGEGESFDQGTYSRGQVNIFQFTNIEDLTLVLAHEFGHALGIEHVEDSQAIMYYLMNDQVKSPITLTGADEAALATRCPF